MGFNRPEAKRLAKAAMRNTNPNPMLVTLVFVLLTTGVSYLVGLVLTNPIYDALYTAYLYLLDGAYDPMFIFKSLLSPGMVVSVYAGFAAAQCILLGDELRLCILRPADGAGGAAGLPAAV